MSNKIDFIGENKNVSKNICKTAKPWRSTHTHTHTHTGSNLINVKKVVNSYFNCDGKIDFYLKSKGAY